MDWGPWSCVAVNGKEMRSAGWRGAARRRRRARRRKGKAASEGDVLFLREGFSEFGTVHTRRDGRAEEWSGHGKGRRRTKRKKLNY